MSPTAVDLTLTRHAAALDAELRASVPGVAQSELYRMLAYHLGWLDADGRPSRSDPGKRLRPALLLLAAEAHGVDAARAMPAAAAVELLHNFSLIHDDIQDRSAERRYRRTVWSIWGIAQAINAGDAMHAAASLAVLRSAERGGVPATTVLELSALLDRCCLRLVEGQYLDLEYECRRDVTEAQYLAMIDGKSATLIATSLEMGAVIGAADPAARDLWRTFGMELGRAFQIADDILGVWGDAAVTGKPRADDVARGKRSLPYVLAAENGRLAEIYALPEREESAVAEAIALLDRADVRGQCRVKANQHLDAALGALNQLQLKPDPASELRRLARYVVERER